MFLQQTLDIKVARVLVKSCSFALEHARAHPFTSCFSSLRAELSISYYLLVVTILRDWRGKLSYNRQIENTIMDSSRKVTNCRVNVSGSNRIGFLVIVFVDTYCLRRRTFYVRDFFFVFCLGHWTTLNECACVWVWVNPWTAKIVERLWLAKHLKEGWLLAF